ncbi:hypothetical protein MBRA_53610 (plasmid) [Mycobacterium branderi]|nr:hypothetical protein MBRA_53610 [Mycobacterium branderi]
MVVAPWWARWLVNGLVSAVMLTAIVAALFPGFVGRTGWLWALVSLAGLSLAVAGPMVYLEKPVRHQYAAALTGLNLEQRSQVSRALRRGEVPSDPRVLASAIRVGTVSLAYLRRATRWQTTAKWWMPAMYLVLAVLAFVDNDIRRGLLWTGFTVYFATYFAWTSYKARRLPQNVELLRAAATDIPEAAAAASETEDSVVLPPRRILATLLVIAVAGIGFGTIGYLSGAFESHTAGLTPECHTASDVVDFIYAHRDMLDPNLITAGDPDLSRYQDWSNQLQNYARQPSTPEVSRHLRRIAELSAQAVSQVQDIRKDPGASPSPDAIHDQKTAYQNTVNELVSEEKDLVSACHPHS